MRSLDQYTEKLRRMQAMIWIEEEKLVDQFHCIQHLDKPENQERFLRYKRSRTFRQSVENVMYGLRTGQITSPPFIN